MACRSSRFHVFPIENEPFAFSRPLCMRTRPDLRTATMMTRAFLSPPTDPGPGGSFDDASSVTLQWVM
jgi:hypothetical protein